LRDHLTVALAGGAGVAGVAGVAALPFAASGFPVSPTQNDTLRRSCSAGDAPETTK
jgi:hypothetical protein